MYFTGERPANVGEAVVSRQITVIMRRERTPRLYGAPSGGDFRKKTPAPDFQKRDKGPTAPYDLSARCVNA